jgi:predicted component of type VI protein secretion system
MQVNLVLLKKNGSTKTITLSGPLTTVGRQQDCSLSIPLMSVSRRHCQFELDTDSVILRDTGSRNGVLVNDQKVEEARLQAGDRVKIGPLCFAVQINGQPTTESLIPAAPEPIAAPEAKAKKLAKEFADGDDLADLDDLVSGEQGNTTMDALSDLADEKA